jgi:uncharacterized protein YpuA (DUF1002 family)
MDLAFMRTELAQLAKKKEVLQENINKNPADEQLKNRMVALTDKIGKTERAVKAGEVIQDNIERKAYHTKEDVDAAMGTMNNVFGVTGTDKQIIERGSLAGMSINAKGNPLYDSLKETLEAQKGEASWGAKIVQNQTIYNQTGIMQVRQRGTDGRVVNANENPQNDPNKDQMSLARGSGY